MLEPVSATVTAFLGVKAAEIIGAAIKDHVKGHVKELLATGEKKLLGKKERDALTDAYRNGKAVKLKVTPDQRSTDVVFAKERG